MKHTLHMRPLHSLADLRPRDHICALNGSRKERIAATAAFASLGLAVEEKILILGGGEFWDPVLDEMQRGGTDGRLKVAEGALVFERFDLTGREHIDPDVLVQHLKASETLALEQGYEALCIVLDACELYRKIPPETEVAVVAGAIDAFVRSSHSMLVCLCDSENCGPGHIIDMLRTHSIVIVDGVPCDNFYYSRTGALPPGDFPAAESSRWLKNLLEHKHAIDSLQKFSSAVEQTADLVMITDRQGTIEYVNPSTLALTGYSRDEMIGHNVNMVRSDRHPESFHENVWKTIEAGRPYRGEFINRKKDGNLFIESKTITPIKDEHGRITHYLSTGKDVTEHRMMAEQLRAANDMLEALFRSTPASIVSLDRNGLVRSWNAGSERLFGWKAEEVIGKPNPLVPPENQAQAVESYKRIAAGETLTGMEVPCVTKDGVLLDTLLSIAPLRGADGVVTGAIGVAIDVSEKRRLENRLAQSHKLESIGRLAGGIAHDFNNLLTVINSYCDILVHETQEGDIRRGAIDEIRAAGERAAALTRQLLAFSSQQQLQPRIVDVNAELRLMERMLGRVVGEEIDFSLRLGTDVGCVCIDPAQLAQVVMNLIVNAREAMPHGGRLGVETRRTETDRGTAHVTGLVPGSYVVLTVEDTGIGFDESVRQRLFDPFFTTKGRAVASGLGLPVAYGIIKQSGGSIEVNSEPGRGSSFHVYLPRVDKPADDASSREAAPIKGKPHETVLLVEDEDIVRHMLVEVLDSAGYRVIDARSGHEALETAVTYKGSIDLLVTDVTMPVMNGVTLYEHLKASRPEIRTLFISGYVDAESMQEAVTPLPAPFLEKPFTPRVFLDRVRQVLHARPSP
jgi:two-component system cell cycle sensor histidine kinase/response regulator CckA